MKKIIFFILIFVSFSNLIAQDSDIEETDEIRNNAFFMVQTGINMSKFNSTSNDLGISPEYFNLNGLSVSFMSEVETNSPYFFKQFGIKYSEMGSSYTSDKKNSVKIKYISLPLLINFKLGSPTFKVFAGFGGYASLAFAGSYKENGEVVSENILGWKYESDGDNDYGKMYHYGDVGLLFGGGFQYILPNKDAIQLSAHYGLGLIPVSNAIPVVAGDESVNLNEKNTCINIAFSYMFGKVREIKTKK